MGDGGWKLAEVAAAQRALVEKQLREPETVEPFAAFLKAMLSIPDTDGMLLLDVGCGVGHYGVLCARYFSEISYFGTDSSAAMIAEARKLCQVGTFAVCEFDNNGFNDFGAFNIVLVSQVLEYQEDPWRALGRVLSDSRGYVILHRLRTTPDHSRLTPPELTYCGNTAPSYEWNLDVLGLFAVSYGWRVASCDFWGKHDATMVLERIQK